MFSWHVSLQIIYWDEKSVFMEHRFITPSDGFVRAIAMCRQRLLDCSAEAVIGSLMERGVKQNGNVEAGVTQVKFSTLFNEFSVSRSL